MDGRASWTHRQGHRFVAPDVHHRRRRDRNELWRRPSRCSKRAAGSHTRRSGRASRGCRRTVDACRSRTRRRVSREDPPCPAAARGSWASRPDVVCRPASIVDPIPRWARDGKVPARPITHLFGSAVSAFALGARLGSSNARRKWGDRYEGDLLGTWRVRPAGDCARRIQLQHPRCTGLGRPIFLTPSKLLTASRSSHVMKSGNTFGVGLIVIVSMAAGQAARAVADPSHHREGTQETWSSARSDSDALGSTEQAKRGEAAYLDECARCHSDTLSGTEFGPALVGNEFVRHWTGKNIG